MTENKITIDINKLTVEELEFLAKITYYRGDRKDTKTINDRIAFLNGWTE